MKRKQVVMKKNQLEILEVKGVIIEIKNSTDRMHLVGHTEDRTS